MISHWDEYLSNLMKEYHIPGLFLSITEGQQTLLSKAYGVRKQGSDQWVTQETFFEAASLSKAIFALIVLQLVEEQQFVLDQPLYEYMEYPDVAHDDRYKRITARMILGHTSGLPNWREDQPLSIAFEPGSDFSYSGEGYVYLQKVIEHRTGTPLHVLAQERIFRPLGMIHSSFIWEDRFQINGATGHSLKGEVTREIHQWHEGNAASSLVTTGSDYVQFVAYILEQYRKGNPLIQEMLNPAICVGADEKLGVLSWSLGWSLFQTNQGRYIWHWGHNGAFKSFVIANLEQDRSLVYFANSEAGLEVIPRIVLKAMEGTHFLEKLQEIWS